MTKIEFHKYKKISDKIIDLLIVENKSSLHDIKIIYNMIMGFPYCIDTDGHYIYKGDYYNSLMDLPHEALNQLLFSYNHN